MFIPIEEMLERLASYGEEQNFASAMILFSGTSPSVAVLVVLEGRLEISEQSPRRRGRTTRASTRGDFTGELSLWGGKDLLLDCRAVKPSRVLRLGPEALQKVLQTEVQVADLFIQASMSRRTALIEHGEGGAIILGSGKCVSDIFVMIGADPNTSWVKDSLHLDRSGFVLTGEAMFSSSQFATSMKGVFAIGDVRSGSVKRVASAVGEGSAVISDAHRYLASGEPRPSKRPS